MTATIRAEITDIGLLPTVLKRGSFLRRRRRLVMATHGAEKFAGFPINFNITFSVEARDSLNNSVDWPYFLAVELVRGGTFIAATRNVDLGSLPNGAHTLESGPSSNVEPFVTPEAPGELWDVRATIEAAQSDPLGSPTNEREVLAQALHASAIRSLTGILPADSGSIQVPGASATVRVGVFDPIIPMGHPDPFNASWTETRKAQRSNFPDGFWSYRIQLELSGRIQNKRDITVQMFFRDHRGNTVISPVVITIPPPSSQGFDWWSFYNVAAWVGNLPPGRYQTELVVFESGVGQYGRRTVWFDMIG